MARKRTSPPRKGPNAIHGGTTSTPMRFVGYVTAKQKRPKRDRPTMPAQSIAELWGNHAPAGEMSVLRQERTAKIARRAAQSARDKARNTK